MASEVWYQNIPGITPEDQHPRRIGSKFWGIGKWETFIQPLIPFAVPVEDTSRTLVELGCNAGLFLLQAKAVGFSNIVGVEPMDSFYNQAKLVIGKMGLESDVKLIHRIVGKNASSQSAATEQLIQRRLPVADITLMANWHYWIDTQSLRSYIDDLSNRSLYTIVVSIGPRGGTPSRPDILNVRNYFREHWHEQKVIENLGIKGDTCPRDMYSILFKSRHLQEYETNELRRILGGASPNGKGFLDVFVDFARSVVHSSSDSSDSSKPTSNESPERSRYVLFLKSKWSIGCAGHRVARVAKLIQSIANKGINVPIGVPEKLFTQGITAEYASTFGGYHRLGIAIALGHKQIIGRIIQ